MKFLDLDKHPSDINEWMLIDQYEYYFNYYSKIYPKCTVLFHNGKFYEFYGVENDSLKIGNVSEIQELTLLNMNYRYPDKPNINTKRNPMCIGFNTNAKSKYISFLIEKGWTLIQVDQESGKIDEDTKIIRGVTIIHSKDTYIDEDNPEIGNHYLVSIVVDSFSDPEFEPVIVGMSAIDITTGETKIYEAYNSKDDQNCAFDEITRFLQSHTPKEVLFYSEKPIDTERNTLKNNHVFNKKHADPKYQTKFLEKIYGSGAMTSIQELLGISRYTTATTSFISLLQYCLDHNPMLVESIKIPNVEQQKNTLVLANNAILQLNLINNDKFKFASIFNLINFTTTAMGYRLLKSRLLYPITDCEELERRYSLILEYWEKYEPIQKILKTICDLEKSIRKITEKNLKNIVYTIFQISKLCILAESVGSPKLTKLQIWMHENVDLESNTVFRSEKLQDLKNTITTCMDYFNKTKKDFQDHLKVENIQMIISEEGCRFRFTNAKYKMVEKDVIIVSSNKTYKFCTTKKLQSVFAKYDTACKEYEKEYSKTLQEFCDGLQSFKKSISSAIYFTAQVDVVVSSIICAQQFNYCEPKVVNDKSFISAKQLRHPIIERISNSIYVPHDIDTSSGMLLYGFNASGKSSLMKSIGVNLVMAQAGLFVAAKKFRFAPYTTLQTRILSNDDMHKGLSSFAVEMSELRGILSRANDSSLVLGDEISRGTETVSGVAIVSAAILQLVDKGSHFLFATHLHQLVELREIKKLIKNEKLQVFHLQVERDLKTGTLIYKRDLEPGCGDSLYGLEVARAMKLPQDFLDKAMMIRKEILNEKDILGKASHFNSEMILDKCGVCGEQASEVHHIRFQSEADDNGFIGHFHKNNLRNLVGLCEDCHKKVHLGKLTIKKWVETSEGMVLKFSK